MTFITRKTTSIAFFAILIAIFAFGVSLIAPSVTDDAYTGVTIAPLVAQAWGDGGSGGCCGGGDGDGDGDSGAYTPPPPPPPASPNCTLSGSPASITASGSATLTWSSSNATSATLNHGIGSVAVNGSRGVSPDSTTTYTLTVSGPGGSASCSTTITITEPTPTCTLTASPSSVEYYGSTILDWTSSHATSATINHGIGSVALNGVKSIHNLTSNKTYTMTVTGPGGSATCSAHVSVDDEPHYNAPTCDLYADRSSVQRGQAVGLSWSSSNATSATLTDFGSVHMSGSRTVFPHSSRTYSLTVSGPGGTRTCTEHIGVYDTPVYKPQPTCSIYVNPNQVAQGKTAVLQWHSNNAVSASISQLGGHIPLSGSRVVYGNTTTQYFMTVRNAYGDVASCATTLGVYSPPVVYNPPPVVYPTPTPQPVVRQYVPVSYVPYTGPEDTAYVLTLIAVLLASAAGAGTLYMKVLRPTAQTRRRP